MPHAIAARSGQEVKMDIIEAALEWRKEWPDGSDEREMREGCNCAICDLIRACDEHAAKTPKPESK